MNLRLIVNGAVLVGCGVWVGCAKETPSGPTPPDAVGQQKAPDTVALAKPSAEVEQAIADVKKLGGRVESDDQQRVIGVDLRELEIKDSELGFLDHLTGLKSLVLWGPSITDAALDRVQKLVQLTELELENCSQITDAGVGKLVGLKELRSINLRRSGISDDVITHLKAFPKLEQLHLLYTRLTDSGLAALKDMTQVTLLDIRGCAYITDAGVENLEGMSNLKVLKLRNFGVSNLGLEKLKGAKKLRVLAIEDSDNVTDDGLEFLAEMTSLEDVTFMRDGVGDGVFQYVGKLPALRRLNMRGSTAVTGSGLVHLKDATALRVLTLSETQLTDDGLANLAGLTNLESLDLWHADQLTDAGLKHLQGLSGLKTLILDETNVSDDGLKTLEGLKNLQTLSLKTTKVTDAGVAVIQAANPKLKIVR